jgi:hypothetical protein
VSSVSPRLVSARTRVHPAGAAIAPAEENLTSIAASMTSPETAPTGLESVSERTLRSVVAVETP